MLTLESQKPAHQQVSFIISRGSTSAVLCPSWMSICLITNDSRFIVKGKITYSKSLLITSLTKNYKEKD